MSINTEMTALANAIRSKTGLTDTLSIAEMTTAVGNIQVGGGGDIDFTGVTVTADKLLEGIVAINATGSKVTGNIKSVTASISGDNVIVPAGFHPEAKSFPVSGGGADVSAVTVTAGDILKGKIAVNAAGQQIVGTIETVSASRTDNTVSVPAGFHPEAQEFVFKETPIDLPFVTATASDILAGKIGADASGNPVNGTIQTVSLSVSDNVVSIGKGFSNGESVIIPTASAPTVSDNVVTIYAGYYPEQTSASIAYAEAPTVSGNIVTLPKGYNAAEKKVAVGTAKAAETITPGTADKTIAADTYLSGALTVKGEPNWTEENIADGVSMWGKIGTHKGGETVTFGYIDEWGKFQALDLSAIPPVASGEAVETDLVAFALPSDIEDSLEVAAYNVYIDTTIADILNKDTDKWCLENIDGNLLLSDDSISKRTMYGGRRADGTEYRLIWYPSSNCYVLLRDYTDIICELTGKITPSYLDGTYTAMDGTTVIISKYEA